MAALGKAKEAIIYGEHADGFEAAAQWFAVAQAYAAVAQAEQLKRIADALQVYIRAYADSTFGVHDEGVPSRKSAPDPLDYGTYTDFSKAVDEWNTELDK